MNIDGKYNSQFIQIDFTLLDDPEFLQFVRRTEFGTYLVLRRYIWRGGEHRLGLHELYANDHLLASSVGSARIAAMLRLNDVTRVSKHLAYLQKIGVIRSVRTGRENIYILGEWHRPSGWDVSKEFYYLENHFGRAKTELAQRAKSDLGNRATNSDLAQTAKSDMGSTATESWPEEPSSNREENREVNTVNGLKKLPDQKREAGKREYLTREILDQLGDDHSRRFYELVAAKVPEHVIRKALAEIKADGADHPAKLFTYRMGRYALERLGGDIGRSSSAA